MTETKVMRFIGQNTKRGYFFKGRVYKITIEFPHYSFLTNLMGKFSRDKMLFARVRYEENRKTYIADYYEPAEFLREWRSENNGFMSNANR